MRLETSHGEFIANAEPLLPLEPTQIVVWGERFFTRDHGNVWREVYPTVVRES